jgi:MFS transporter, SP family, galactose:H+ symporter
MRLMFLFLSMSLNLTIKTTHNKTLVVIIASIAATGGLLFGFDTGVISGAIPYFQKNFAFEINDSDQV